MYNRSDESIFIRTCYVPYRGVSLPTALEHGGRGPWDDGAVMAVGERTMGSCGCRANEVREALWWMFFAADHKAWSKRLYESEKRVSVFADHVLLPIMYVHKLA
jgi:hypothetical protein